jgi:hypothetical protein
MELIELVFVCSVGHRFYCIVDGDTTVPEDLLYRGGRWGGWR